MNKEQLLTVWLDRPFIRPGPIQEGAQPMCATLVKDGFTLLTSPCQTKARRYPYEETDGLCYRWMRDGEWLSPGYQTTFEEFEQNGPCLPPQRLKS